jgi:decaprenylphospho-beta-D-erythro-pentofuranosid-2-ulose 2-reductase
MKDALGTVQSVLVLGGGSDIALATCRRLAPRARTIVLAARKPETLEAAAGELRRAGAGTVGTVTFDATDYGSHDAFVDATFEQYGDFDVVLVAFGVLGDQSEAERDGRAARDIVESNYLGAVSVGVPVARRLRDQGHGTIVVMSSVAGERARRSNFVYGSSKAGLDAFFQGFGDALTGSGVDVMIIRPGFVHSKMTAGLKAAPLATTPDKVADAIVDGLRRGREIVWVPGALRWVMVALRHLPRAVFRRLPL